ncbi:MAG: L-2-amino-thiazoline-4-carboxylic acid hydrolase [Spirochaetales bacterium]|nr:L-2-amino-thiazoline-4-carboxylic acid hydrolase [Spirochaetales bacterium]
MLSENQKKELNKKARKVMKSKKLFKTEIAKRFAPSETEKIWGDAENRLFELYASHTDLPKGVSAHTDSFIFPAAAIYLAMKEADSEIAYDIMKTKMAEKSDKMGQMIAKCCRFPGFKKFFLSMWDTMSHKMFGETAGFKNVFYPKEKSSFRMDITQCPYHTYLTEAGCPELNVLFCENDIHSYGNLPGLKFTRTKTIGAGDELCDFKMELL